MDTLATLKDIEAIEDATLTRNDAVSMQLTRTIRHLNTLVEKLSTHNQSLEKLEATIQEANQWLKHWQNRSVS